RILAAEQILGFLPHARGLVESLLRGGAALGEPDQLVARDLDVLAVDLDRELVAAVVLRRRVLGRGGLLRGVGLRLRLGLRRGLLAAFAALAAVTFAAVGRGLGAGLERLGCDQLGAHRLAAGLHRLGEGGPARVDRQILLVGLAGLLLPGRGLVGRRCRLLGARLGRLAVIQALSVLVLGALILRRNRRILRHALAGGVGHLALLACGAASDGGGEAGVPF